MIEDVGEELLATIMHGEPNDRIWQLAIDLSDPIFAEHTQSQYRTVATVTLKAIELARHPDTFGALATCLLEHLLEYDFSLFDELEQRIRSGDRKLLYTFGICSKFGLSEEPQNAQRWNALEEEYSDDRYRFSKELDRRWGMSSDSDED